MRNFLRSFWLGYTVGGSTILLLLLASLVGCGSTDNRIPIDPPAPYVEPWTDTVPPVVVDPVTPEPPVPVVDPVEPAPPLDPVIDPDHAGVSIEALGEVVRGMTAAELTALLGEPTRRAGDSWVYDDVSGRPDRRAIVQVVDGVVWGPPGLWVT